MSSVCRSPKEQQEHDEEESSYDTVHKAEQRPTQNPNFPDLPFDGYLQCPLFPRINVEYPGLQLVHERPYIFIVNDFLTQEECQRLIDKASTGMKTQTYSELGKGVRNSTGVVCQDEEVPRFREKVMELTQQKPFQLQSLKISRYEEGQEFTLHTDAVCDPRSMCADTSDMFGDKKQRTKGNALCPVGHNRFMTVFVYLNDVAKGGCTAFPRIGIHYGAEPGTEFYDNPGPLNCKVDKEGHELPSDFEASLKEVEKRFCEPTLRFPPQRGQAVLHFPTLSPEYGGTVDGNVMHCSEPAVDVKYICQQFIYSSEQCKRDRKSLPSGRLSKENC